MKTNALAVAFFICIFALSFPGCGKVSNKAREFSGKVADEYHDYKRAPSPFRAQDDRQEEALPESERRSPPYSSRRHLTSAGFLAPRASP